MERLQFGPRTVIALVAGSMERLTIDDVVLARTTASQIRTKAVWARTPVADAMARSRAAAPATWLRGRLR